jgi:hypothetical protein
VAKHGVSVGVGLGRELFDGPRAAFHQIGHDHFEKNVRDRPEAETGSNQP